MGNQDDTESVEGVEAICTPYTPTYEAKRRLLTGGVLENGRYTTTKN